MKNRIILYLLGCIAILSTGCSTDVPCEVESKSEKPSSILQLKLDKAEMTRGMITSSSFQEGDEALVYIMNSDAFLDQYHKATYKNGMWVFDSDIDVTKPFVIGSKEYEWPDNFYVSVGYPYDKLKSSGPFSTFVGDSLLSQADVLYGEAYVSKEYPVAEISCKHCMSCLTFKVKNNSDNTVTVDRLTVKQEKIAHGWMDTYYTFLTKKGLIGPFSLPETLPEYIETVDSCSWDYNVTIKPGETGTVDFLLYPTDALYKELSSSHSSDYLLNKLHFELYTNGKTVQFDMDPYPWEAGRQYTYPVNLTSERHEIEPTKIHMYDTYDGKHVYWSNINIGATSETDYGRLFGWGDPSGTITSENLNDYPSANPPENIAGTEYDIATVNWGGKWRMPSDSDVWDLRRSANYEAEWTSVNDVYGVRVTSNETGNSIFLPSAPQRIGTTLNRSGFYTHYWLSKLNPEDNNKAYTIYFDYNTAYDNPLTFWGSVGCERYYGLPVRAIWIDE